ncbi:UNVERIFIED_CONTAM: hypothetical protein GTU68_036512 [Idotea baltica]|nr:hypothetical protein [Idotea baltica]
MVNESGQVKLLDFGIARLLDEGGDTGITQDGHRLYTPDYASPEQAQGKPVGTATDIYSLGVILYELLTGFRPLALTDLSPAERERRITQDQPQLPSQKANNNALKGDLDTICLKALRKEPERRYGTASELADDLQRHLDNLPVKARPDTFRYRSRKFFQRNQLAAIGSSVALLLLISLSGIYTWQLGKERDRAELEADKANQVKEFLVGIFEGSNPVESQGDTITARHLLDKGAERIETELADQPALKMEMLRLMGTLYQELGLLERSRKIYNSALSFQENPLEVDNLTIAGILMEYADLELNNGFIENADSLITLGLAIRKKLDKNPDELQGALYNVRGDLFLKQRQMDSAKFYLEKSLNVFEQVHEVPHDHIAKGLQSLGVFYVAAFNETMAIDYMEKALEMFQNLEQEKGQKFREYSLLHTLGVAFMRKGETHEAMCYFDEALVLFRKSYGNHHPKLALMLRSKAILLADNSQSDEALTCLNESMAIYRALYGDNHPDVAGVLNDIGTVKSEQLDRKGAEEAYREALAIRKDEGNTQAVGILYSNLGVNLEYQGKYEEAEACYLKCLNIDRELHGNVHQYIVDDLNIIGQLKEAMEDYASAINYYEQALAVVDSGLSEKNRYVPTTYLLMGRQLNLQKKTSEAMPLLKKGLALREEILPPNSPHICSAQRMLAEGLMSIGEYSTADSLLQLSLSKLEETVGSDHPLRKSTEETIVELNEKWRR